jgi:hypothetical protein
VDSCLVLGIPPTDDERTFSKSDVSKSLTLVGHQPSRLLPLVTQFHPGFRVRRRTRFVFTIERILDDRLHPYAVLPISSVGQTSAHRTPHPPIDDARVEDQVSVLWCRRSIKTIHDMWIPSRQSDPLAGLTG